MNLAVVIVGAQNSGKTSTIRYLINKYSDSNLANFKAAFKFLFLNSSFKSIKITAFCIPSSPSESNRPLATRFQNWNPFPQILILPEQPGGQHYLNTINFLQNNNYKILYFHLSNQIGINHWDRFDSSSQIHILDLRADEIIAEIRTFINVQNLI